ncbi:MBL fold metallo-hydrolase [Pacificimonas flava]|uniref:MBL fold metallo-hydrolase n=2 Tax=Pacificimonas TaxID=1960290 RepID=A0A219B3Z5_9SPHN|nr:MULTISPECIES: MBL fold metallo-hydrolase [Pacificimonas]MBZ6377188.1 MBL fold metallo-hydrolase [Pacificimonas aurantium]OWV33090.1 MBL fold metallo-hydrolase [Pacificimonas flava]
MTDVSLTTPPETGETRRKLFYPHGRWHPEPGDLFEIAAGVFWLRMPMPFSLDHINLWILDGGAEGWTLVDTSIPASSCKDVWRPVLKRLQAEKPVTRLVSTHYHPDHLGLAGWLCKKTGASFAMTQTEYLMARMLLSDQRDEPPEQAVRFNEKAGYPLEKLEEMRREGWGRFARAIYPLPDEYLRLKEGDVLTIGARDWEIVVGSGHTPEHACLLDRKGKVLIAGDQVLPRITSNISLHPTEPMANPLGDWLDSIEKLRALPDDLLILPAHGFPFKGLHERLDQLEHDHRHKLGLLRRFLSDPRKATDTFEILFGRPIGDSEFGMATGEALAHLRWLEAEGLAMRQVEDGTADLWRAV